MATTMASAPEPLNVTNATDFTGLNSSNVSVSDPLHVVDPFYEKQRIIVAYFFCLAVILPVGIVCNSLCIAILCASRSLRKSTTAHYLVALAFADTAFLLGEMLRWSSWKAHGQPITGYRLMHEYDLVCKLTYLLRYSGKVISAWTIVIITAERFITIAFPLRVGRISTIPKARVIILVTVAVGLALGSFPLWTVKRGIHKGETTCIISDSSYDVWNTVVLRFGQLFIPSFIIFVLTGLIAFFLAKARRRRREHLQQAYAGSINIRPHGLKVERQLTTMLLFVAVAFLLLRLPYTLSYYLHSHKKTLWPSGLTDHQSYVLYLLTKVSDILATTNYAINFFLYCLSGSIFRQQVTVCFHCDKPQSGQVRRTSRTRTFSLSSFLSSNRRSSGI